MTKHIKESCNYLPDLIRANYEKKLDKKSATKKILDQKVLLKIQSSSFFGEIYRTQLKKSSLLNDVPILNKAFAVNYNNLIKKYFVFQKTLSPVSKNISLFGVYRQSFQETIKNLEELKKTLFSLISRIKVIKDSYRDITQKLSPLKQIKTMYNRENVLKFEKSLSDNSELKNRNIFSVMKKITQIVEILERF